MFRCRRFVETTHRRGMRRRVKRLGIVDGFLRDFTHHGDKRIERVFRLRFRRLYHNRLVEQQREIDRRRMKSVVEQPFCHVERRDTGRFVEQSVEHEFMFAHRVDWQFVAIFQTFLDVIRVERCQTLKVPSSLRRTFGSGRQSIKRADTPTGPAPGPPPP